MKKIFLSIFIILSFPSFSFGQTALPESRRSSSQLLVYRLNEKDVRNLYLKEKEFDESMLHTLVVRCAEQKDIPALPRGNYITVRVVGNKLEYTDHTVDNFYYKIVKDEKMMLLLCDTIGNVIDDAIVKRGPRKLRFDKTTRTYNTSLIGGKKTVEVNNGGVLHYIEISDPYTYRSNFFSKSREKIKKVFNRVFAPEKVYRRDKYSGFVVFSKPKYKPGETVKFKAYINNNGKPYNEEVKVALHCLSWTNRYGRRDG